MTFGEIPGVPVGAWFDSKQALSDAGVHRQVQGGMWGGREGTKSIVLNEGYVDDEDLGERVIYTGHGGQDRAGRQVSDQEWTRANAGMRVNMEQSIPVRVIRGHRLRSPFAPPSGFRYDGLYMVDRCWQQASRHGPLICRFELREVEAGHTAREHTAPPTAVYNSEPGAGATPASRQPQQSSSLPELSDEERARVLERRQQRRRDG